MIYCRVYIKINFYTVMSKICPSINKIIRIDSTTYEYVVTTNR